MVTFGSSSNQPSPYTLSPRPAVRGAQSPARFSLRQLDRLNFDVNNLDPHQLAVFRELLATYCFSHEISDKNFPPLLFTEVVLCLNLDDKFLPSIEAYAGEAHGQARDDYSAATRDSPGINLVLKDHSSVFTGSNSKSMSMTKERAKLARDALRYIHSRYELCQPDQRAMMLVFGRLTEMVKNHSHY